MDLSDRPLPSVDMPTLEQEHVLQVYSQTHKRFSTSRYRAWPSVERFIRSFESPVKILEVGSGNGKNIAVRPDEMCGCDICPELVQECVDNGYDVVLADACCLPYEDNHFDAVISVAVLHHLSTVERREQAIREMIRVCKPGGKLLIEVWALEGNDRAVDGADTMVPWKGDCPELGLTRYYHFFEENEILELVSKFCTVEEIKFEKFNWLIYGSIK